MTCNLCLICKELLDKMFIKDPNDVNNNCCMKCIVFLSYQDENNEAEFKIYDLNGNYLHEYTEFLKKDICNIEDTYNMYKDIYHIEDEIEFF